MDKRKSFLVSILTIAMLITTGAVLLAGCSDSPGGTANFRFLLSDDDSEVTAIGNFTSVIITVSKIGFQQGGESGNWTEPENYEPWTGDLLELIGTNATVLWEGYVEPGDYTKAFMYVSSVTGTLNPESGGGQADIWIPSDKLQITVPFTVNEGGAIVDFVFDITVIKAGKSGQYLIMPQVGESGPDQEYREVDEDDSEREIEFKGTIQTIADSIWTVSVGDEVWSVNITGADIEGTPDVGLKAKIEGMIGEGDIILASKVEVEEIEEAENSKEEDAEGVITAIDAGNHTVTITTEEEGHIVLQVTPDTRIEIEDVDGAVFGDLEVGQQVKVKYDASSLEALEIEVKEGEEEDVEGIITAIDTGDHMVTITTEEDGDIVLQVTPDTKIEIEDVDEAVFEDLEYGLQVKVKYDAVNLEALEIEVVNGE